MLDSDKFFGRLIAADVILRLLFLHCLIKKFRDRLKMCVAVSWEEPCHDE